MEKAVYEFFSGAAGLFKKLSLGKKLALMVLVSLTVGGSVLIVSWASRPDFGLLYADLNPEDAGVILAKLREQKTPYQISAGGRSISIPRDKIYESRLELASQGLPQSGGAGFELFDDAKLGMTEFIQNVNYQRALQGELARTINQFNEVESSRIHIVMPEKSLFLEREQAASASVVVKVRSGKWLTQGQVQGIVHLVSSSISGLSPENVTIVDNNGKLLAGKEDPLSVEKISSDQLTLQGKVEKNLEQRVKSMLEKAFGVGKAVVRVSCLMDFKRYEQREERYYPDNTVIRSEQMLNEATNSNSTNPSGIPGVTARPPGKPVVDDLPGGGSGFKKQDRTVNYEVGKMTSHVIEPVGQITRISVAVIVDGTYHRLEQKDGQIQHEYVPRSAEEMEKIENIVKSAVSFNDERGDRVEVVNMPFESTPAADPSMQANGNSWLDAIAPFKPVLKYAAGGLMLLCLFLIVMRPLVRWVTAAAPAELEMIPQLPKTVGEIEREYDARRRGLPAGGPAGQLLSGDNEAVVRVMRNWLKDS